MSTDTRRFTIGGSDCGAAAGVHPYMSAVELWARKTGRMPEPDTEAMEWGTRLQPVIFDALADRGYNVHAYDGDPLSDQTCEWATGTPDGFVYSGGRFAPDSPDVLEAKTASVWAHRAGWDTELPPHYAAQGQWYMMLTGAARCMFAVLIGGQHLETRTVERSDHAIRLLLRECAKFHSHLVTDTPPPPDGSKSSRDALLAMFPQAEPESVIRLTRSQMRTVDHLRTLKRRRDAIDAQIGEAENTLRLAMGDAARAISPTDDEVITWRSSVSHRVDTKRLKADRPEIHSEYTIETTTRRFLVKGE